MNHSFVLPRIGDKSKCEKCKRVYTDHTVLAVCDSCGAKGSCNYYESGEMLLCDKPDGCSEKHENALRASLNTHTEVKETVLELAKRTDLNIRYNGDAFNAKTIANQEVRKEIYATPNLTEAEKHYKYQEFLLGRVIHFRQVMFNADVTKFDAGTEVNVALSDLRNFAGALATDIQSKLKESDKTYSPAVTHAKVSTKGVRKNTKSAKERLIEAYAEMHGIDLDAAKRYVELGGPPKPKDDGLAPVLKS